VKWVTQRHKSHDDNANKNAAYQISRSFFGEIWRSGMCPKIELAGWTEIYDEKQVPYVFADNKSKGEESTVKYLKPLNLCSEGAHFQYDPGNTDFSWFWVRFKVFYGGQSIDSDQAGISTGNLCSAPRRVLLLSHWYHWLWYPNYLTAAIKGRGTEPIFPPLPLAPK